MTKIAQQLQYIDILEDEERSFISQLQTISTGLDGHAEYTFNSAFSKQNERTRLYAVRLQIFQSASTHFDLLKVLQKDDLTLAEKYRLMMVKAMTLRYERMMTEVKWYIHHGHGVVGMNAVHVHDNRSLAAKMVKAFKLPEDNERSVAEREGRGI
ncbi:hypothetical protein BGZ95_006890 [Linnemannia exigua]|uniref:Uncharacterized protein n=1 Tax=Linnemannia exigua TaxID=604196 RepID=A0AAD4GZM2_9FUNG|nr:hypothetical protein BGZ95_006890 [Linnemannia exigua]